MSVTILAPSIVRKRQFTIPMESASIADGGILPCITKGADIGIDIPDDRNLSEWLWSVRDRGRNDYKPILPTADDEHNDIDSPFSSPPRSPIDSQVMGANSTGISSIVSLDGLSPKEPAPPQHVPAASGPIEVERRLSLMERIQLLTTASSLRLKAELSGSFTKDQRHKLRQLSCFVQENSAELFRGRTMPQLVFSLVSIVDVDNSVSKTMGPGDVFICVIGLASGEEIQKFHLAISQKTCRSYYAPLRICYDRSLVSCASREYSIGQNLVGDQKLSTTCGRLMKFGSDGEAWVSTVGGLIEMDGCYFLLAGSSHKNSTAASQDTHCKPGARSSSLEGPTDFDLDYDAEPPLLLDEKDAIIVSRADQQHMSLDQISRRRGNRRLLSHSSTQDCPLEGMSWRLVPANDNVDYFLPNYISIPPMTDPTLPRHFGYIEDYCTDIKESQVIINAGVSGVTTGHILGSPSYFLSDGSVSEVWTVQLRPGTSK